jgi:hypothetical protein
MTQPETQAIPYASPRPPEPERHNGIGGGVVLLFAGLGMILLGGCFLIGIVRLYGGDMIRRDYTTWPLALQALPWVLYLLAFGCFAGAAWMIRAGVRWLYAVG